MNKPFPPPPPRRPGSPKVGGAPGPAGQPPTRSKASGSTSSSKAQRPPLLHFGVALLLIVIELWMMMQSTKVDVGSHFLGAAIGMFMSVVVLGHFRQSLNGRRSSGAFSEWGGPIESTKMMWGLVLISWVGGTWHLWIAMYEVLRPA